MNSDDLIVHCWTAPVAAGGSFTDRLRALERAVTQVVRPMVRDPVVQEHACAYHVNKDAADGSQRGPTVGLTLIAPPEADEPLQRTMTRHLALLPGWQRAQSAADPRLHPLAADYRRGLTDATAIALDLHSSQELRTHQCFLIRVACNFLDPRFDLHPYLIRHSPAYVTASGLAESSLQWSWEHEQFWARLYTPGPVPDLGAPISTLWNIILGLAPRRWDDPAGLAARLGITCP